MAKNIEIINELREISILLADIPKVNIQTLPKGYFDQLEERICINSLLHQNETKEYFNREMPGVPTEYFEKLSDSILLKIKEVESLNSGELFPLLDNLKNKNVFKVPNDYFDGLSEQITARTQLKKSAKVISISGNKWWKYAATAMIAGIMLIGGFFMLSPGDNQLARYLAASQQYQTSSEIEDGIASLNDDDIVKYLQTHGNITDNEMLLENIDTDALPAELDYLLDHNALNKYLDKINIDQK